MFFFFFPKQIQRLATESLADPDTHRQPACQSCHCTRQQSWGAATANGKGITRRTRQTVLFACRKLSVWFEPYCTNSGFTLQPLLVFALQCCSYGLQQDEELVSHEEKGRTEARSPTSALLWDVALVTLYRTAVKKNRVYGHTRLRALQRAAERCNSSD